MANLKCPKCGSSDFVVSSKTFTKAGAGLGAVGGAAGVSVGTSTGAAIGAGGGAVAGGAVGTAVDKVLGRYKCNKCDTTFDGD